MSRYCSGDVSFICCIEGLYFSFGDEGTDDGAGEKSFDRLGVRGCSCIFGTSRVFGASLEVCSFEGRWVVGLCDINSLDRCWLRLLWEEVCLAPVGRGAVSFTRGCFTVCRDV
jgi:hypothetical protein